MIFNVPKTLNINNMNTKESVDKPQKECDIYIPFYRAKRREQNTKFQSWIYVSNNKWCVVYIDGKNEKTLYGERTDKYENSDQYATFLCAINEVLKWICDPKNSQQKSLCIYMSNPFVVNCINEWSTCSKWKSEFNSENSKIPYIEYLLDINRFRSLIDISAKTCFNSENNHITPISDINKFFE